MNRSLARPMLLFVGVITLGGCAGLYAYISPENIEGASRSAISALSIIFGLSTAVSSLLSSHTVSKGSSSNDPHLAAQQKAKALKDDDRTLFRQKMLHLLTLGSIILGIVYLVAIKDSPCALTTRILAFAFASGATISLLSTMFLPNLLTSLIKRNAYFQRHKDNENQNSRHVR